MVPWAHPSPEPKCISIGLAVFAGLTTVMDRQIDRPADKPTDHATRSVTIGCIYVPSTAMRPNNIIIIIIIIVIVIVIITVICPLVPDLSASRHRYFVLISRHDEDY